MPNNFQLQENVPLAPLTTLKLGGRARYLVAAKSVDEARQALAWAQQRQLDWVVLGAGSNTLVADTGYAGLVVVMRNDQAEWKPPHVTVGAGMKLGQLVAGALQHDLGGLWWLIGVPGSVGGAIYGNAGSRDQAIGQYVQWVETLEPTGQFKRWSLDECEFRYRHSRFKEQHTIIIRAGLQLPAVDRSQEQQLLKEKAAAKQKNQPLTAASAGCMFKNPSVEGVSLPDYLQTQVFPDKTISAWRLIAALDLPGFQLGQMQISTKHANFMINLGGATADQVVQLLSYVKQQVRDNLGVQLQEEVQYLGF